MLSSRIKFLTICVLAFSIAQLIHMHLDMYYRNQELQHRNHVSRLKPLPQPHKHTSALRSAS
jgi:hypothetical protein